MNQDITEIIDFFYEEIDFTLSNVELYITWINEVIKVNDAQLKSINYIFCSDEYLLNINKEYLDHDYYTDIISFPYSETPDPIHGDIFISVERVIENAADNKAKFEQELLRVMSHGLLHFLGYQDKSDKDRALMRKTEEKMMRLFRTSES